MSGKVLAHFLSAASTCKDEGSLFQGCTFSLFGFSLGSQIAKSCINRLQKIGNQEDLIHNTYFMAGATFIKNEKQERQRDKFKDIVNGRICNIYTSNDTTLSAFNYLYKEQSIGRKP